MTRIRLLWLVCAYLALYTFGFVVKPAYGAAAIWPAHALSFVVLALVPFRKWPRFVLAFICCDMVINPVLHEFEGSPPGGLFVVLWYAIANVLTSMGPAALARIFKLFRAEDRYQLVISPLWIVALLLGVVPGALLGTVAHASRMGESFSAAQFGLWGLAAVLAIVTMGPAMLGAVLGFSRHPKAAAKRWEGWVISATLLALLVWFVLAPRPAVDVLVEPMLFTIPLAWLALRFSQRTTSIAVAVVAAAISVGAGYRTGGISLRWIALLGRTS